MSSLDLAWAVRSIDSVLRRRQGIEEFTGDPECLFRISLTSTHRAIVLSDGTAIGPTDPIVEIHYWNEHMPPISVQGLNTAWAATFKSRVEHSLALVADLLVCQPRFAAVAAICAAPPFAADNGGAISARICRHLGFDVIDGERKGGPIHTWLDSILVWMLTWTFNRVATRRRRLPHRRIEVLMSRRKLIERYGGRGGHPRVATR